MHEPLKRYDGGGYVEHLLIEEAEEGAAAKRLSSLTMSRADQLAAVLMGTSLIDRERYIGPRDGHPSHAGIFAVPANDFP